MSEWAYYDANGTPLRGPCLNRRCNLMSKPGGLMHDGQCLRSYADPPLGYYRMPWYRGHGHARPHPVARPEWETARNGLR